MSCHQQAVTCESIVFCHSTINKTEFSAVLTVFTQKAQFTMSLSGTVLYETTSFPHVKVPLLHQASRFYAFVFGDRSLKKSATQFILAEVLGCIFHFQINWCHKPTKTLNVFHQCFSPLVSYYNYKSESNPNMVICW